MKTIKGEELVGKELEVLEDGTLRLIEKPMKFIPNVGEEYWYIDSLCGIEHTSNNKTDYDIWALNHNLVFKTKEECEEYRSFLDLLDEYKFEPDWNNHEQNKYYLLYDNRFNEINIRTVNVVIVQGVFYFKSGKLAQKFIDEVGKDNVKRFMFDIWE